jgi:hypothetical protein
MASRDHVWYARCHPARRPWGAPPAFCFLEGQFILLQWTNNGANIYICIHTFTFTSISVRVRPACCRQRPSGSRPRSAPGADLASSYDTWDLSGGELQQLAAVPMSVVQKSRSDQPLSQCGTSCCLCVHPSMRHADIRGVKRGMYSNPLCSTTQLLITLLQEMCALSQSLDHPWRLNQLAPCSISVCRPSRNYRKDTNSKANLSVVVLAPKY